MNVEQKKWLYDLQEQRDKELIELLRYLILLAAGSLSILVSLQGETPPTGFPGLFLRLTWIALALGILLGGMRLYGELSMKKKLVVRACEKIERSMTGHGDISGGVQVPTPAKYRYAEWGCYIFLAISLLTLAAFAVLR
jgi:hypothetical protein